MRWTYASQLVILTGSAGFRGGVAAILVAAVVMLCGARVAAAADKSDKEGHKPLQVANEPEAMARLHVRKIDTDDEHDRYRKTQLQLIKSPLVLASALRRPGIADLESLRAEKDQLAWLRDRIEVTAPPDSEVLQIQMRGAHPRDAQQIVDAVAQAYLTDLVIKPKVDALNLHNMKQAKLNELMIELEAMKREADVPANANADREARRNIIQRLQATTTQMGIELAKLAKDCNMPSRVELIEETGDGAVRAGSTSRGDAADRSDAADSR